MSISAILAMTISFVVVISLTTYSLYKTLISDFPPKEKEEKNDSALQ